MNELMDIAAENLPPELMLDQEHPMADEYITKAQNVQRMIVATSALLTPPQVKAVKLAYSGEKTAANAKILKVNPATIRTWLNKPDAKKLMALLIYYQAALDGPNEAQRVNMLWRIATANEILAPKITISAVAELNKMTMVDYDRKQLLNGNQPITIVINQEQLPRTALDG